MSPQSINKALDVIGEDYDLKLHEWKDKISSYNKILKLEEQRPNSFNVVLDNIDIKVLASDRTSDNQNKDYHWCNHNVHLDRVNPLHLENDAPRANLQEVPNSAFLPSLDDQNSLLPDFVILVGTVIVENLSAFAIFKDVIPFHIKHKYSGDLGPVQTSNFTCAEPNCYLGRPK